MIRQFATAPIRMPSRNPLITQQPTERGHEEDEPDLREEGEVSECVPAAVHGVPVSGAEQYSSTPVVHLFTLSMSLPFPLGRGGIPWLVVGIGTGLESFITPGVER